jgi:hypothetical protein
MNRLCAVSASLLILVACGGTTQRDDGGGAGATSGGGRATKGGASTEARDDASVGGATPVGSGGAGRQRSTGGGLQAEGGPGDGGHLTQIDGGPMQDAPSTVHSTYSVHACTVGSCGDGRSCRELIPGGPKACFSETVIAVACDRPSDECCSSTDCRAGACVLTTRFPSGGCSSDIEVLNACSKDACAGDADCAGGICAVADVFGSRRCVAAACRRDSDCTLRAGGACVFLSLGCCAATLDAVAVVRDDAAACMYPGDGCAGDLDCPSGSFCTIADGIAACRTGPCRANDLGR